MSLLFRHLWSIQIMKLTGMFSPRLLIIVMFLHIANLSLLGVRKYLLAHEPPPPTIKEENTDGIIFLY
jgi:hypothetical protein